MAKTDTGLAALNHLPPVLQVGVDGDKLVAEDLRSAQSDTHALPFATGSFPEDPTLLHVAPSVDPATLPKILREHSWHLHSNGFLQNENGDYLTFRSTPSREIPILDVTASAVAPGHEADQIKVRG